MDEAFTYKDRITFYKKDMWRQQVVVQCIIEETEFAKKEGKEYLRIGSREVKIEGIEGFLKAMQSETILEERVKAAAALLNMPLPGQLYFLDTDEAAENKRVAEEKAWK